jgi:preprotein translocase subunit SecE
MAKEKTAAEGAFRKELFHAGVYKRSQGRIARQVTFATIAVSIGLGVWQLRGVLHASDVFGNLLAQIGMRNSQQAAALGVPLLLFVGGLWLGFRVVNWPKFADFLIAVEAEMNKVSWPSRGELGRSTIVVLFTIFFLASVLAFYDLFWGWFFRLIGIQ